MFTLFRSESFQQNERLFHVSSSKITHIIHPGDKINVEEAVGMCENFLYLFPTDVWFQTRPSYQLS